MASMKPKKSSLPPPKPRPMVTVGAPKREINGRIIIGIIVAAVVALGVVIALVVGGGDDESADLPPIEDVVKQVTVNGAALDPFTQAMIQGETADTAIGDMAPVVSGVDYDDNAIAIDAAADGPTMVVLLAHWCPHCNAEIPHLNEWRESGNVPEGLNVVGVSTGINAEAPNYPPDQWLVDKDWQWPVLADSAESAAFQAFGGEYFPTVVIIGSDGRVLTRFSGEPSAEQIDELVGAALADDPGSAAG
jgi:cytochrome c biogenesis protein CcmG/thiol:disulfide interchange protein DsbE